MSPAEAVIKALDALECGDSREAVAVLLAALEGGASTSRLMFKCRKCSMSYEWPGLRSHHELLAHGYDHEWEQERAQEAEDELRAA